MDVDQKVRLSPGYIVSFGLIAIAMLAWLPDYDFSQLGSYDVFLLLLAKTGAFGGMVMFALSLILSGRIKVINDSFRGLDKAYRAHRFFGTLGITLLLIHPLALVLMRIPEEGLNAASLLWNFNSLSVGLGVISIYGMLAIIIWSVVGRVSHETFIKVHRLLGGFFVLGATHAFLAGSIVGSGGFMYWYILLMSITAAAVYAQYSILGDILRPHYNYKVHGVRKLPGNVLGIQLKPTFRSIDFQPGQFVYASFSSTNDTGYHPFTIASGRKSQVLEFYIKQLGDFTRELADVKHGDVVRIKGPYGGFTFNDRKFDKQLWIAGGIGITPFLSKARSLERTRIWPKIELIHATMHENEGFATQELTRLEHTYRQFNFTLVHASKFGQQSLHDLAAHFGGLDDYAIYICGPPAMLAAYKLQAEQLGLSEQLFFEEFGY